MLHPLFVAGVLEGFEGTLDEVIGRVENPELNAQLDALRGQVAALRICAEEPVRQRKPAGPVLRDEAWAALADTRRALTGSSV
jgi:hypothetical protein